MNFNDHTYFTINVFDPCLSELAGISLLINLPEAVTKAEVVEWKTIRLWKTPITQCPFWDQLGFYE